MHHSSLDSHPRPSPWWVGLLFALSVLLVGSLPGVLVPVLNPDFFMPNRIGGTPTGGVPGWVFALAWIVIYPGMGLAAWQLWRRRHERDSHVPLVLLAVGFLQTWSFYFTQSVAMTTVIDATGLVWAYTVAWVCSLYSHRTVMWLLPWLMWMPFTFALKVWIWVTGVS